LTDSNGFQQRTLQREVSESGIGLFTGEKVTLHLRPAPPNHGLVFRRIDLPGKPQIPARLSYAVFAPRCTRLMKDGASVQTVEHLLSALHAYGIANLEIGIEGSELPAGDGSSSLFVEMLEKAGVTTQNSLQMLAVIKKPISWSEGEIHLVALPSDEFRISYTLHYPHSAFLRSQYYSYQVNRDTYKQEIAPCRTFSLYEEIEPMLQKGLLKSAGLENGVVIKDNKIMNPEGTRFENEMVRHKILDLIGDLSLIGVPIQAHIISIRSGHFSNIAFSKKIQKYIREKH